MDSIAVVIVLTVGIALVPRQYLIRLIPVWMRPKTGFSPSQDMLVLFGVLCFLAIIAMNPEARIVFAAIDAVGLDIFVLLVALQLRTMPLLLAQVRDWWYRHLGLPGYRLSLQTAREIPIVAVYVVVVSAIFMWLIACVALRTV